MSREAKAVFSQGHMVSFKTAGKTSSYIVRAKLYISEKFVTSRQFKKRKCKVCTNVRKTGAFSSAVTGKTFQINYELNCDDKCLIYLLKCKVSKKTICRRNNGYISAKVEQLQGQ